MKHVLTVLKLSSCRQSNLMGQQLYIDIHDHGGE